MRLGFCKFRDETFEIRVWDMQFLGSLVSIDTETELAPFTTTPQISTFQAFGGGSVVYYVPISKISLFLNKHSDSILLAQNMPFDCDVIHKATNSRMMYDWYDRDLIRDTGVLYRLLHLASTGTTPFRYNLALLTEKFLGVKLEKDERRESFAQFIGKEIIDIPVNFLEYGALDVIATYQIYHKLIEYIANHDVMNTLLSHSIQVKGDLALNHIRKNGIGFDLEMRDKWLVIKDEELAKLALFLGDWGLIRGVPGYKKTYKHIMENMLGLVIPYRYKKLLCKQLNSGGWIYAEDGRIDLKGRNLRVKEGETCHGEPSISSQRDDLEEYYDSHGFIKHYLDFQQIEKASSFVRDIDSDRVHSRYNLLVNTGRTSCSKPNFQQLPKLGGIREMFMAPKGKTFIITDYSAVELATLAQVLYSQYGKSVMRDKINEGLDLHKYYGTIYYNKPIDKITKAERQTCKAPNFGFPGGLGAKTFIQFSKGYGLDLTETEAKAMKDAWFNAFPETREYMKDEKGYVFTLTGRKRGNTTYCAEKNSPFQGVAADGAKLALYNLDREGFKIVGFVHDEIICEVADELAVRKVSEQERIMIESMQMVVPDVKIGVESAISPFYTK